MAYRKQGPPAPRGPAGPAGNLGRPKSFHQLILTFLASHDQNANRMGPRSRVPRRPIQNQKAYPVSRRTSS